MLSANRNFYPMRGVFFPFFYGNYHLVGNHNRQNIPTSPSFSSLFPHFFLKNPLLRLWSSFVFVY